MGGCFFQNNNYQTQLESGWRGGGFQGGGLVAHLFNSPRLTRPKTQLQDLTQFHKRGENDHVLLSPSAVIMESSSRVRSESMEPISCNTSPVLRLILSRELSVAKDILGPRWLLSSSRTVSTFSWFFDGPHVDMPVLLGRFDVGEEVGFQSGILEGGASAW